MGKIIFIKNSKGGVAKSTNSKNIATGLAKANRKIALVSFDAQNDSLHLLGKRFKEGDNGIKALMLGKDTDVKIKVRKNLDYFPLENDKINIRSKKKMEAVFQNFKNIYDIVIIDGAPADTDLSQMGTTIADEILVPIELETLSIGGISRMLKDPLNSKKIKYIIPNRYHSSSTEDEVKEKLDKFLENTKIYFSDPIKESAIERELKSKGKSIFETKSKKAADTQKIYIELIKEIIRG